MIQSCRFEYKFLIPEFTARRIASELRPFMRLDSWLKGTGKTSYIVSSVYLDSPRLHCYEAVDQGARNRFKLRMRWYGKELADPVFLEEKRRTGEGIRKIRIPVERTGALALLEGCTLSSSLLLGGSGSKRASGELLMQRIRSLGAIPSCIVCYDREAWESPVEKGLRVTFDRDLVASTVRTTVHDGTPASIPRGQTILEIKFQDRVPEWLSSLVRRYNLARCSVPKYVMCVDALRSVGHGVPMLPARLPGMGRTVS
ncbi:MAG: hypothetical protein PWP23_1032 [Candidatus Sumerlaeota bacterium]|nr:hypothetical protein [Candidatus Sumerlaeota bacterium]